MTDNTCQSIIEGHEKYNCPSTSYEECLGLYTKGICWKNQPEGAKNYYSSHTTEEKEK